MTVYELITKLQFIAAKHGEDLPVIFGVTSLDEDCNFVEFNAEKEPAIILFSKYEWSKTR